MHPHEYKNEKKKKSRI